MSKIIITQEDDGSEWLPMPHPNVRYVGCEKGEHRIGKLIINNEAIRDSRFSFSAVLSQVEVMRCEYMGHLDALEFIGFSEYFMPSPMSCVPPIYNVVCHTEEGRIDWFEFIRENS